MKKQLPNFFHCNPRRSLVVLKEDSRLLDEGCGDGSSGHHEETAATLGVLGGAIAIGGGHHPPVECLVPDLVGKITTVVDTDPLGGMGAGYEQSPGYPGHPQVVRLVFRYFMYLHIFLKGNSVYLSIYVSSVPFNYKRNKYLSIYPSFIASTYYWICKFSFYMYTF